MAAIKARDTAPELRIRRLLHAAGFRYRLHARDLPGTPDLVFPSLKTVVFVHGCFWHVHECAYFRWPRTRTEIWREKLLANAQRDRCAVNKLLEADWSVLTVWECALRSGNWQDEELVQFFRRWTDRDCGGNMEISMYGVAMRLPAPD